MSKKLNTRIAKNGYNIKRIMALILVLGMILTVTGCSGGDSQTMGSRLNTENAVDKVLNQKTDSIYQEEDRKSETKPTTETGATTDTELTTDTETTTETELTTETGTTTETETTTGTESASATEPTSEPTYGQVMNGDSSVIAQYKSEGVDVDLTLMGKDLIYATVYQMMSKPEEYEGKTIRIEGKYYASYYPLTDKYYNYCLIADAAACCSQGLEFELGGGAVYPDDYPADQSQVIVTGVFETYTEEAGQTFYYCRLRDAEYQLASEAEQ